MRVLAVVTAAGQSRRLQGRNKMLLEWKGEPVLVHTVRRFQEHPRVDGIALSAPPGLVDDYRELMQNYQLSKVRWVVAGGSERQHSISNALEAVEAPADSVVMIHDGARPFLTFELIDQLLDALTGFDGVLPALPVTDTVKKVNGDTVAETLVRATLRAVQTPQVFGYDTILSAHRKARESDYLGTDDASLVEWCGGKIRCVEGERQNLKITTPEDIHWMEFLAQRG